MEHLTAYDLVVTHSLMDRAKSLGRRISQFVSSITELFLY